MKFGTKLVLYYSVTSMIVLALVGVVVTRSIEKYWIGTVEQQLAEQSETVKDYIRQVFIFEQQDVNKLDEEKAKRVTSSLSPGIGQIQLYSSDLKLLSGLVDIFEHPDFNMEEFQNNILLPAQQGSTVNDIQNNIYYFASPVIINDMNIGILVISYRLNLLNLIISRVFFLLCLGAAAFCVTIIILSITISRRLVVPIKQLVTITGNYANRDFTLIELNRKDELGQLGKSINDMGLQLKDHIERQKQFVSNVSHELRTPLAAIKGYSEYLADETAGNPDLEKAAYHLNNETARLTNMVNDLLQLSRMDSSREVYSFGKIDLPELVSNTIERMRDRAEHSGIVMESGITPDIYIEGDRDKLIQVIVNVFDNSIKYSGQGSGIKIDLTLQGKKALLKVADQGIGIPAEDLDKVFERFYRSSNVRGIGGTGLGLAISKEIIERHEGAISLKNAEQGGTEVSIVLPVIEQFQ